jgi:hypothetical protein
MMKLKQENDNVTLIQEIEYKDRCLEIEIKVSERFGFVSMLVTDMDTGNAIDLDLQLNSSPVDFEMIMTSNDNAFAKLTKNGQIMI